MALVERRLKDAFSREEGFAFEVEGAPKDIDAARDLAERDRLQFQYWACSLLLARPVDRPKKGGDQGVDGVMFFNDEGPKAPLKKIVISVKSGGNLNPGMVRDLAGTVRREKAVMGIFLTLAEPTKGMLQEATASGEYVSPLNRERYPAVQIVTVQKLLGGGRPKLPPDLTSGEASHRKNRAAARGPEPKGLDIAALDSPE
ncbi:MAG: restriction endonuclease [Deltaproteobacteria bacterium]|nr:restriction endonuclease [Deltaproteobacteria bacterium]